MGRALRLPTRREVRDVSRLAVPIVVVQVGIMLMGVVDAAMVGRVSAASLAAVALGNLYWILVVMVGQGTIMALDPVVSQAVGAGKEQDVTRALQRGIIVALILSLVSALALLPGRAFFALLRQPQSVAPVAAVYARVSIPGLLPFFLFVALRQTLQAFRLVRPVVVAVVVSNVVNAILDWALIFGHLGATPMGALGSAYATMASRWIMLLILLVAGRRALVPHLVPWHAESLRWEPIGRMLGIGIPIGLHQWIEIAAFSAGMILVGWLGTVPLAAHQIALTIAALTYMVPLGVSAAAAVLVGHAIGRGDADGARREASAALVCGVGFMAATALVLLAAPTPLARLFTSDPAVAAIAATLIPIAGVFQVFDGVQGVSSGVLRGAGDTRVPMVLNLAGYALAGLPFGAWLCFRRGLGAAGIWWGFVGALIAVAIALGWRVHARLGGDLRRIHLEEPLAEF